MPKSDYMLRHLSTKEQQETWLDIYKTMKERYMIGFLLGVISSIPASFALC
jgi:cytochrome bd-type quinol oxidase subunit 1